MKKRSRVFLLVASAILVAGIGTAGLASYLGLGNIGLLASDSSEELGYIPSNAELVAYIDVRQVMDSALRQRLQPGIASAPGPSRLYEETGINIETDVDSVVVAAFAGDGGKHPPLMLARGRFNMPQIEASLRARGGAVSEHGGVPVVTTADQQFGVAFIKTGLVAAGSPVNIRLALDAAAAGAGSITENAEVMQLVRRVNDADTWTVARFAALQGRTPLPSDLASQMPSITWFAAGGRISDGVSAVLHAQTRDEQSAQDLREVISGMVALVRLQAGQQPEFAELLNSVELSGEGTTVSLGFAVPAHIIDRLGALAAPRPPVPAVEGSLQPFTPVPRRSGVVNASI